MCGCGVLTVTLQYLSLRFEPEAFRSLVELLAQAQRRLDLGATSPAPQAPRAGDDSDVVASTVPSVH